MLCDQPIAPSPTNTMPVRASTPPFPLTNLFRPSPKAVPVKPNSTLLLETADVQVFLVKTDDFPTEAALTAHNALNAAPEDDNIFLLSPHSVWIPGQSSKLKPVSENAARYSKNMDEFEAMLAEASSKQVSRPTKAVPAPVSSPRSPRNMQTHPLRAESAVSNRADHRSSVVIRPATRPTQPVARRPRSRDVAKRPTKAMISGPTRMASIG